MAVRPGIVGIQNFYGKQVGTPATTTSNATSAYVYTKSSSTDSVGNPVTGTTYTLSKIPTSNPYGNANWVYPDTVNNAMVFTGTQSVAYSDDNRLHVVAPYSCQVDFNTTTVSKASQWIVDNGQGSGIGWEEFIIYLSNNSLIVSTCASNGAEGGSTASGPPYNAHYTLGNVVPNTWYRVGVMWYNVGGTYNSGTNTYTGGTNYIRGYLNGEIKFQRALDGTAALGQTAQSGRMPYNSGNGIAIGNDNANYPTTFFQGSIRNFFIGRTLFWPI